MLRGDVEDCYPTCYNLSLKCVKSLRDLLTVKVVMHHSCFFFLFKPHSDLLCPVWLKILSYCSHFWVLLWRSFFKMHKVHYNPREESQKMVCYVSVALKKVSEVEKKIHSWWCLLQYRTRRAQCYWDQKFWYHISAAAASICTIISLNLSLVTPSTLWLCNSKVELKYPFHLSPVCALLTFCMQLHL